MSNLILVKSEGSKTRGVVLDSREVTVPTAKAVDKAIKENMVEVARIASGVDVNDPMALKSCSSCIKLGRTYMHKLDQFSLKKDGKRHSQCKKCRSEQATEYNKSLGERRRIYSRNYNATYKPKRAKVDKTMVNVINTIAGDTKPEKIDGLDSMFIAIDKNKS